MEQPNGNGRIDLTELPEVLKVYDGTKEYVIPLDRFVAESERLEAEHKEADGLTLFNYIADVIETLAPGLKLGDARRVRARKAVIIWTQASEALDEFEKKALRGSGVNTTSPESTGVAPQARPARSRSIPSPS